MIFFRNEPIAKLHFCHDFVGGLSDFSVLKCFRRSDATRQSTSRRQKRRDGTKAGKTVLQWAQNTGILLFACIWLAGCGSYEKETFRTVSFHAAEKHWDSILPFEFIKTGDKNQWCDNENVVFQVSIFEVPDDKDHREWREHIKKTFFDMRKNFAVISESMVSFQNWQGTKVEVKSHLYFETYWFLSDGKFFMFASLIDGKFHGKHPRLPDIDHFFLFLKTDGIHPETMPAEPAAPSGISTADKSSDPGD